jgi:AcrR family transcriptional regulator
MGTNDHGAAPRPGLRERKKEQTRRTIAETARAMFAERGYDGVTVAEIADAASVSVKTLFTYFSSKEDLVFEGVNEQRDEILQRVRERAPGESPLDAIRGIVESQIKASGQSPVAAELEGFHRMVAGSVTLQSRLRLMWEHFEEALAEALAEETGSARHDPRARVAAAQLISIYRLHASEAARAYVLSHPPKEQREALERWLQISLEVVGNGIASYAKRPEEKGRRKLR